MRSYLKLVLIAGLALAGARAGTVSALAADQGVPRSEVNSVGGVPAEPGNAVAIYQQGLRYDLGKEVPRDLARAEVLYRHAADMGSSDAMLRLGYLYENYKGALHDEVQAAQWYRKASDAGHGKAMLMLGNGYWSGRGVVQDYVEAYKWISLSEIRSTGRDKESAANSRVSLSRVMSPAMIEDAQGRAREWQAAFEKRSK